jgi:hypothetical protein
MKGVMFCGDKVVNLIVLHFLGYFGLVIMLALLMRVIHISLEQDLKTLAS